MKSIVIIPARYASTRFPGKPLVQGDEPYVDSEHIDLLVKSFEDEAVNIATLAKPYKKGDDIFDENKIRVVMDNNGDALYFSRSAIPFVKNASTDSWTEQTPFYQHIGMYAYRLKTLKEITALFPSKLEKAESLEQLRWLENGYKIRTVLTDTEGFSIDTPEDLQKLLKL